MYPLNLLKIIFIKRSFDIDGKDGFCFGMLTSFVLISSTPGSAFIFFIILISIFITLLIINLQTKFIKNNILIIIFTMNLFNDFRITPFTHSHYQIFF